MESHSEVEEEIIIETEMLEDGSNDEEDKPENSNVLTKKEADSDEDFKWDAEDPFEKYDPPIKKIRNKRRKLDNEETGTSKRSGPQKYKKDWEDIPQFRKWLSASIVGAEYFYCKMCKTDAKCGKSEIMRHMTSKKHARNSQTSVDSKKIFEGLLCPVFSPIDRIRVEEVNYTKVSEYAEYLRKQNIKGVLVNDILGEGMSLTIAERCQLTEEWRRACDKTKQYLMVQVGGAPQKEVIRMVRHAASRKVDAILVLPDFYNKPMHHFDLLRYIKDISDHAENLPIWYHHCPNYSNVRIDMKSFMADVAEIESFVGIMFSSDTMGEVLAASSINPKLYLMVSTESDVLSAAAFGIKSAMCPSLNILPKEVQNIFNSLADENITSARESQKLINSVFEFIYEKGHNIPSMKSAMTLISKVTMGPVRRPLVDVWRKQVEQMQNELKILGIIA